MAEEVAKPDLAVARTAARQYGVASIRQLREAGLSDDAVAGRVRAGRLHRIHRGVYAVGHPGLSREGSWIAAVLACGNGAVLSHRSAAELWALLPPESNITEVSVGRGGGRRRQRGIQVHRSQTLLPALVTRRRGIPVTTPSRTVADIRGRVSGRQLRHAIRQAGVLGLDIRADASPDGTRSELEYLFLRLCRRYRLPAPAVNVPLGALIADFVWGEQRLIVETDGYQFHRGRTAFEDDHSRDLRLRSLGYEVIRLSYRQVVDEPRFVAEVLAEALETRLATYPVPSRRSRQAAS